MSLRGSLEKLVSAADLTSDEASAALEEIIDGEVEPALVAAFLVALRMKGERPEEISGLARTMRERALAVTPKATGLIDTCGTGGSGANVGNVSTTTAFVVAGAGIPVAKHGNRALSSQAGSADVLEALGVPLDLDAAQVARCIDEAGIGFMFAPAFHPAMAKVMPVRRALGIRTAFNILGPLTNPARPSFQLVGVGSPDLAELVAGALAALGTQRAMVVHGAGGADELTCTGECVALWVEAGAFHAITVSAAAAGLPEHPVGALVGGSPQDNARVLRDTLGGAPGPMLDCVLLNAGAALMVADGDVPLPEAVERAREVVASGAALDALDRFVSTAQAV